MTHEVRDKFLVQHKDDEDIVDYFSPKVGKINIQLIYTLDVAIFTKVICQRFVYLFALVLGTYIFKKL
jgi:hypothetical protein